MLTLAWPWMLWVVPLPLVARLLSPPQGQTRPALQVPAGHQLTEITPGAARKPFRQVLKLLLLWASWLALVIAAARPTWVGEPLVIPTNARDLLLAVDISGSMEENEDMELNGEMVSRLVAVKKVVSDFIQRRKGDRVGLILFGTLPYLQTPLTFDLHTLNQLLLEAQAGFAGPKTAIGDAIGLAVKKLSVRPAGERVLILLTDGVNNAGEVTPAQAAELAADKNIRIYTIGVGADELLVRDFFFTRKINPSAELDEATLKQIAQSTGGRYFRARNPAGLEEIYSLLDKLEPVDQEGETLRPTKALFYWPLSASLVLSFLLLIVSRSRN